MPLRFVAIVNSQNQPVYFHSSPNTPENVSVNQQFIAEMSLDFVEQQMTQLQAQMHIPQLVVVHDGIAVYALLANTRTKYLIGISSSVDADNISSAMKAVADAYTGYQCNPFGEKNGPIKSSKFDKQIERIILSS